MNHNQVMQAISETPKGANIIVSWERPAKTKKSFQGIVNKQVRMVGRIGVQYDNLKAVKEKRESGELPAENQGLAWGQFLVYPYLIGHKGKEYLRLYHGTSKIPYNTAKFFVDGTEVEKSAIEDILLASEKIPCQGDCFVVQLDYITQIHSELAFEVNKETEQAETVPA